MRRYQQPGVSVAAPSRPIERGLPIPSLLAQVIGAKYADLCPLTARDMLPMRRAFIAFAIAGLLALFLMVKVSVDAAWLATSLNASHGLVFAVVAVLLLALLRQRAGWLPYLAAMVGAISLGVLIEFLQSYQGRPPSLLDVLTDFAGAVAGLALWSLVRRRRNPSKRPHLGGTWMLITAAIAGVAFIVWPPVQAARAYAHRTAVFPDTQGFKFPRICTSLRLKAWTPGWSRCRRPGDAIPTTAHYASPTTMRTLRPCRSPSRAPTGAGTRSLRWTLRTPPLTRCRSHFASMMPTTIGPTRTDSTSRSASLLKRASSCAFL